MHHPLSPFAGPARFELAAELNRHRQNLSVVNHSHAISAPLPVSALLRCARKFVRKELSKD